MVFALRRSTILWGDKTQPVAVVCYTYPMYEGDDDDARLKEARQNRQFDPNKYFNLKKDVEAKKKKSELQKEKAQTREQQVQKIQKLKQDMDKKGVANVQTKEDAKKFLDEEKRKADVEKAQGTTEQGAKSV